MIKSLIEKFRIWRFNNAPKIIITRYYILIRWRGYEWLIIRENQFKRKS